jgi:hypothetical protein
VVELFKILHKLAHEGIKKSMNSQAIIWVNEREFGIVGSIK